MAARRVPLGPLQPVTALTPLGWSYAPTEVIVGSTVGVVLGVVLGRTARTLAAADRRRQGSGPAPSPTGRRDATVPITEGVAVAVVAALLARFGFSWEVIPFLVVATAGLATGLTDLRDHRIPDRIVFPAIAGCSSTMAVASIALGRPEQLLWASAGAALYGGILLTVHLAAPQGLGRGDVKLAVLLGGAIGWLTPVSLVTVELVVWALTGASGLGLVIAIVEAARGRLGHGKRAAGSLRRRAVPFGPALSTAALGVVLIGDRLLLS